MVEPDEVVPAPEPDVPVADGLVGELASEPLEPAPDVPLPGVLELDELELGVVPPGVLGLVEPEPDVPLPVLLGLVESVLDVPPAEPDPVVGELVEPAPEPVPDADDPEPVVSEPDVAEPDVAEPEVLGLGVVELELGLDVPEPAALGLVVLEPAALEGGLPVVVLVLLFSSDLPHPANITLNKPAAKTTFVVWIDDFIIVPFAKNMYPMP